MDSKQFDHIIQNKLSSLESKLQGNSWDLFEEKLDAEGTGRPEMQDQAVDELAFNRLHRLEVPYEPTHWNMMAQRIREEFSLAHRIYRYKIIEISVFLFAVFTLIQVWPNLGAFPIHFSGSASDSSKPKQELHPTTDQATQSTLPIESKEDVLPTTQPQAFHTNEQEEEESKASIQEKQQSSAFASHAASHFTPTKTNAPTKVVEKLASKSLETLTPPFNYHINKSSLFGVVHLLTNTINFETYNYPSFSNEIPKLVEIKDPLKVRIGMFGSGNIANVLTASNTTGVFESFTREGLGYGGGISIGLSKKRWEFETGLSYSAMQYAPWILEIRGSIRDGYDIQGLKNTELNIVSLPLYIRYNFIIRDSWHFYTTAGLAIHVAAEANYYTDNDVSDFYPGREPNDLLTPSGPPPPPSQFDSNNFQRGWLEGGAFKDNSFFTGNIGIGAEYFFNTRWSTFVQPTYMHSINYFKNGIGPNRERFNSYQLSLGIKVNL